MLQLYSRLGDKWQSDETFSESTTIYQIDDGNNINKNNTINILADIERMQWLDDKTVSVRRLGSEKTEVKKLEKFLKEIENEIVIPG